VIVAIVQARMGSSRLPGKTLADVAGRPLLVHVVERVRKARRVDKVVVATTDQSSDDPIAALCRQGGIDCFRGSEDDVLDRFYRTARANTADSVVRITADCPLIDPAVIDKVIARFQVGDCDYVSNTIRYTYPDGLDTEVCSFAALEQAWGEAKKPSEREHVTPYLRTEKFRSANVESESPVPLGKYRWTVDYPADLEFVRKIYEAFSGNEHFGYQDIFHLLKERPELATIQAETITNEGYYKSLYQQAKPGAAPKRPLAHSQEWLERAKRVIPGCAQTFSKGYTQYVQGVAPVFLQRGKGCRVWDVDGNEYVDYVQGLLPNILGYAHSEVNAAAAAQTQEGHSFSLPHPLEVQLAERLTRLIPCAEMVRFGKNGSDATSGAVRAARAFTRRDRIACCGYHGWQDWFIGSTTRNAGVPQAVRQLTHPFIYNDLTNLEKVFNEHPGEFAAVIMEPVNFVEPLPGFLAAVKELAHKHGALLIFDEICTGFHFGLGGAQKLFGVTPDLACFGKAMGNGFPISCVLGRADVMRIFSEIFFSFTFAGEVASMAAAMKVLDILESTDALARMEANGRTLQDGVNAMVTQAGLSARIKAIGRAQWSLLKFTEENGTDSPLLKNLFQQEALKRGVLLLVTHNITAAHDTSAIHQTLEVYAEVIKTLAGWLQDSDPARFLEGPMTQPVFRVR
jgi:glutamate-1-semialdehyde aminotransferase/spore coat polysaccharide biosynthesis protein SpsF (cytidylyltransferase family)